MGKRISEGSEFPKRVEIFVILLIALLAFGTLGFVFLKNLPINEAFIRTTESFAFMFQEQAGPGKALEIFLSLFGVFMIWWVLWSFFDMLLEGKFSEYLKAKKFVNKLRKMKNHYIVAGGGRVGEEVAKNLAKENKEYVIIEKDDAAIARLRKRGFFVIQGDAHDESVLKQAGIMKAKAVIITLPETEKVLVATMIAKEMNPAVVVYARAENPNFASKLKKAGAKSVVVPEIVAAERLMQEIE